MAQAVKLRDYQTTALAALWEYWRNGGGNPLVDLATGLGKSLLLADMACRFALQKRPVLIVSHVREIVEQDREAILSLWPDAPIGINSAALGERNTDALILLATVQSIYKNPEALGPRSRVMVDEAHLVQHGNDESMYGSLIEGLRPLAEMRVAGFTATPFRLSSGRLDEGEGRLFDKVVFSYGIGEGIRDGWLAPLVAKAMIAEIDTRGVARRGGEFVAAALEAAADVDVLVRQAADEIIQYGADRRAWLSFCTGVRHAEHVRDALRARGVVTEMVIGETPAKERAEIFAAYKAGEIRCLTGVNVFTTGFNVPHVDLIAMLRPTLSPGLYVQTVGRGTRKSDGKKDCLILDFSGNVMRHGPVDKVDGTAARMRSGNGERGGDGGEKLKVCPTCRTFIPQRELTCAECGHQWPPPLPPRVKHNGQASVLSPLSGEDIRLPVVGYDCELHMKPGSPPSLRVDYFTNSELISDWLPFGHSEGARFYAARKWKALGGSDPIPRDAYEALNRRNELKPVIAIEVAREGRYWRVRGVRTELAA